LLERGQDYVNDIGIDGWPIDLNHPSRR
jgi:hypothetical protein